jgi:hypothetical protein
MSAILLLFPVALCDFKIIVMTFFVWLVAWWLWMLLCGPEGAAAGSVAAAGAENPDAPRSGVCMLKYMLFRCVSSCICAISASFECAGSVLLVVAWRPQLLAAQEELQQAAWQLLVQRILMRPDQVRVC